MRQHRVHLAHPAAGDRAWALAFAFTGAAAALVLASASCSPPRTQGACATSEECAADEACAGGACYPRSCGAEACRQSEVCANGACTFIRCVGVVCGAGEACADDGRCLPTSCGDKQCADGAACLDGACVSLACVGVSCGAGEVCAGGLCWPQSCAGVACGAGHACVNGLCADAACVGVSCTGGLVCSLGVCEAPQACIPGSPPTPCGAPQSACASACEMSGVPGACLPPTGPFDAQVDPLNCGLCGNACPPPAHAQAACAGGVCGRGPCESGFFDLDGPATPGCEAACTDHVLTDGSGASLSVSECPAPESGVVARALSSGGSFGAQVQTSTQFTQESVLGGDPAAIVGGAAGSTGGGYLNVPGFGGFP